MLPSSHVGRCSGRLPLTFTTLTRANKRTYSDSIPINGDAKATDIVHDRSAA